MNVTLNTHIPEEFDGLRLDQALSQINTDYSRAQWQAWIKAGHVQLDGKIVKKPREKVRAEQIVDVDATLAEQGNWEGQAIELNIPYEDDDLIIVNKAAGLVVHPGAGNPDQTLINALLYRYPELIHLPRAGIVHRLDKDTTGLLVVARNLAAHHYLVKAIQERGIKREYQALVFGEIIAGGTIDAPIGRHPTHRTRMAIREGGRESVTHYRIMKKFPKYTLLTCELESGRTHQIRVHMAHVGHPIVGDPTYGQRRCAPDPSFKRQALHAWRLSLVHPTSGEAVSWEADLPEDVSKLISLL